MAEHAYSTPAPTLAPPPVSRRGLMSATAATTALASAALITVAHAEPPGDDTELLATIAAFDALERGVNATYDTCADSIEAEEAAELAREPLQARQAPLLARICSLRATTMAGCGARARSLMLWDSKQAAAVKAGDDPDDYWNSRMVIALLRDLTQGAVA